MSRDVFCSTYTKDYKWWEGVERSPPARGFNVAFDPEKDIKFLSADELKPGKESDDTIRLLRRLWWKTTYRIGYCRDEGEGVPESPLKADVSDELMDSMERVLHPAPRKLLPPPDTSRVVFGFCPTRRFRSGRTFYTDVHSRPAFEILKRTIQERGTCRLASPKREYPEPDYSTPPCLQGKSPPPSTWIHLKPDPHS